MSKYLVIFFVGLLSFGCNMKGNVDATQCDKKIQLLKRFENVKPATLILNQNNDTVDFKSFNEITLVILKIQDESYENVKMFYLDDKKEIEKLISQSSFVITNSDMTTCTSELFLFSSNKLVYKTSVDVENNAILGMQNSNYGWVKSKGKRTIEMLSNFKSCK